MNRKIFFIIIFVFIVIGGEMLSEQRGAPEAKQTASIVQIETHIAPTTHQITLSPVIRVVDGDTIVVEINGTQEKVRLIGVDTPETVDPRKKVECFGKEASSFVTNLLSSKSVHLESDATQGDRDKYGRLLRFVFLPDGMLLNKKIIEEGYGHEYTYRIPYRYQTEFKGAEHLAREEKRGLWGDMCTGR